MECWSELFHAKTRILAYHQAVLIFLKARRSWPHIFRPAGIQPIYPVFESRGADLKSNPTSADIITSIAGKSMDESTFLISLRQLLGTSEIDHKILQIFEHKVPGSRVHGEVKLLNWLHLTYGGVTDARFFNGWAYIGSSKPTCLLCHYYFEEHDLKVEYRPSHNNVYPSWQYPGNSDSPGLAPLYQRFLGRLCNHLADALAGRVSLKYKKRDSNTFTVSQTLDKSCRISDSDPFLDSLLN